MIKESNKSSRKLNKRTEESPIHISVKDIDEEMNGENDIEQL